MDPGPRGVTRPSLAPSSASGLRSASPPSAELLQKSGSFMSERPRSLLLDKLQEMPIGHSLLLVATLVALVTAADLYSNPEIPFTLAYLLPIALSAWRLGRGWSVAVALSCGLFWGVVQVEKHGLQWPRVVDVVSLVMELGVFLSFGFALDALRQRLVRETELANTDSLTGLANRRCLLGHLDREVERSRRFSTAYSLVFLDIDGFKQINDTLGHQSGDELLQAVADQLSASVRRIDVVARLGGDEFALLLPWTGEEGAVTLARRLQQRLNQGLGSAFDAACSVGCVTVLEHRLESQQVLAHADQLMYEAKRSGKGELRYSCIKRSEGGLQSRCAGA